MTNASGQFRIENLAPGTRELQVTALGYQTVDTESLTIALDSETRVTITMEIQPLVIERLVVTAMKTARSSEEVSALITVVDREDIDARGDLELIDALENVPGPNSPLYGRTALGGAINVITAESSRSHRTTGRRLGSRSTA